MHDGAFATLEAAVRHHLDPASSLRNYDVRQLDPLMWNTLRNDTGTQRAMLENLAPQLGAPRLLSDEEVNQLLAFLESLTDPAALDRSTDVPRSVPSGLPVRD
jgi:cytochrome c peroxidase